MSYDSILLKALPLLKIERSPDHWWVTTFIWKWVCGHLFIERSPDHWWVTTFLHKANTVRLNWKVTRSLVSYDVKFFNINPVADYWRVTRSLVSYDVEKVEIHFYGIWLKGHQIIGELRRREYNNELRCLHWRVTRSLVSYDIFLETSKLFIKLKGHQIIGELRLDTVMWLSIDKKL